jgi:hypothetical protein
MHAKSWPGASSTDCPSKMLQFFACTNSHKELRYPETIAILILLNNRLYSHNFENYGSRGSCTIEGSSCFDQL